jgi:hypothetical protein
MLSSKPFIITTVRLVTLSALVWPCCGWTEPRGVPPAPSIIVFPADISIHQSLVSAGGVVDPFVGTTIDVSKLVEERPSLTRYDPTLRETKEEYQFQAGVNIDLGKSVALNYDPVTRRVNTELSLSPTSDVKSKTRFRLRVKSDELRVVMVHRF